jgi:hypothetical protein
VDPSRYLWIDPRQRRLQLKSLNLTNEPQLALLTLQSESDRAYDDVGRPPEALGSAAGVLKEGKSNLGKDMLGMKREKIHGRYLQGQPIPDSGVI